MFDVKEHRLIIQPLRSLIFYLVKMVRLLIYLALAVPLILRAQSPHPARDDHPVKIQMPNCDVTDVLKFYAELSKRKVWVELGLTGKVTVFTHQPIPLPEALSLIRRALLQEGFQIREVGESEAFVSHSTDPRIEKLRLLPRPSATAPKVPSVWPHPSP
jgi:hypothetical protein